MSLLLNSELKEPENTLKSMLKYKVLPQHIESVFIHNILKLFAHILQKFETDEKYDEILELCQIIGDKLNESIKSAELEVQERSSTTLIILKIIEKEITDKKGGNLVDCEDFTLTTPSTETIASELLSLFNGELNPVAPKAQKKVPIPDGLDLDAWINEPIVESDSESEPEMSENLFVKGDRYEYGAGSEKYQPEPTEEEIRKVENLFFRKIDLQVLVLQSREARKQEQQNNPHYLKGSSIEKNENGADLDAIPMAELNLNVPLKVIGQKRSDKYLLMKSEKKKSKKKKGKKKKQKSDSSSDENMDIGPVIEVKRDLELPEGATLSDSDSSHDHKDDPHRALDIDLDLYAFLFLIFNRLCIVLVVTLGPFTILMQKWKLKRKNRRRKTVARRLRKKK